MEKLNVFFVMYHMSIKLDKKHPRERNQHKNLKTPSTDCLELLLNTNKTKNKFTFVVFL